MREAGGAGGGLRRGRRQRRLEDVVVVLQHGLHQHVAELELEDGGYRVGVGAQQRRPPAHGQVGRGHEVLVAPRRHPAGERHGESRPASALAFFILDGHT